LAELSTFCPWAPPHPACSVCLRCPRLAGKPFVPWPSSRCLDRLHERPPVFCSLPLGVPNPSFGRPGIRAVVKSYLLFHCLPFPLCLRDLTRPSLVAAGHRLCGPPLASTCFSHPPFLAGTFPTLPGLAGFVILRCCGFELYDSSPLGSRPPPTFIALFVTSPVQRLFPSQQPSFFWRLALWFRCIFSRFQGTLCLLPAAVCPWLRFLACGPGGALGVPGRSDVRDAWVAVPVVALPSPLRSPGSAFLPHLTRWRWESRWSVPRRVLAASGASSYPHKSLFRMGWLPRVLGHLPVFFIPSPGGPLVAASGPVPSYLFCPPCPPHAPRSP